MHQAGKYLGGLGLGRYLGMVGLELTGTCGGCVWGVLGDTGACTCRFEAITLARQSPSNNLHDYHCRVFRASELLCCLRVHGMTCTTSTAVMG